MEITENVLLINNALGKNKISNYLLLENIIYMRSP